METEFDKANHERTQYILKTQQNNQKPKWTGRETRILRGELRKKHILKINSYNFNYICAICNLEINSHKFLMHMRSKHSEILKEIISHLVSIGLYDPSFSNAYTTIEFLKNKHHTDNYYIGIWKCLKSILNEWVNKNIKIMEITGYVTIINTGLLGFEPRYSAAKANRIS